MAILCWAAKNSLRGTAGVSGGVFYVVIQNPPNLPAMATRHSGLPLLGERAG